MLIICSYVFQEEHREGNDGQSETTAHTDTHRVFILFLSSQPLAVDLGQAVALSTTFS